MESRNPEIHIPMELWFDILSFLPVKTLLRFRAVSKYFVSLVDDPNFVSFHLRSFPANCHETRLFVVDRGDFQIHETAIAGTTSRSIKSLETGFPASYRCVRGSINGLVLLSNAHGWSGSRRGRLLLWNPSTRKKRWIPIPSWFLTNYASHSVTLGYDHLRRDYKVLILHTKLGLYSVSKGSWKTLHNGAIDFGGSFRSLHSSVSFDGGVAWVVSDHPEEGRRLLLFDFGTEAARYAALPCTTTADMYYRRRYNLFRVDGGRGLGLEGGGQVWELETEKMTWISQIGAELTPLRFLTSRKENGELVISTMVWTVWSYKAKTLVIKSCVEDLEKSHDVSVYVESLVKL